MESTTLASLRGTKSASCSGKTAPYKPGERTRIVPLRSCFPPLLVLGNGLRRFKRINPPFAKWREAGNLCIISFANESSVTQNPIFQQDIVLDGLAQRVVADVNHFFSKERVERAAVLDERQRLARELHDGLLQSLTGAALQLNVLSQVVELNPRAARIQLREIEELITEQQRELRTWIENRLLAAPAAIASAPDVRAALDKVCRRAEWQWGFCVELTVDEKAAIPRELGDAIYRIVQEGLTNIGRHAGARRARVQLVATPGHAVLTISDDGIGFPFRGRYEFATLNARNLGPVSLKQRVASLHGDLVLTSALSGSQLEISLPFARQAWPGPVDRSAVA